MDESTFRIASYCIFIFKTKKQINVGLMCDRKQPQRSLVLSWAHVQVSLSNTANKI